VLALLGLKSGFLKDKVGWRSHCLSFTLDRNIKLKNPRSSVWPEPSLARADLDAGQRRSGFLVHDPALDEGRVVAQQRGHVVGLHFKGFRQRSNWNWMIWNWLASASISADMGRYLGEAARTVWRPGPKAGPPALPC